MWNRFFRGGGDTLADWLPPPVRYVVGCVLMVVDNVRRGNKPFG